MRTNRSIFVFLLSMMSTLMAFAQEVIVNITPVQEVLPPQVMLYIADPGKYFNISLTNTSSQPQDVYLGLQVQQETPSSGLSISTPPKRQPSAPLTIPANGVRQLTMTEIKTLFNHIPSNEIMGTPGLIGDYTNGSFGLLPEGRYKAVLTAYRWSKPQLAKPVVVSNPLGGTAYFTVCYKAQAPQILMPVAMGSSLESSNVASLDVLNPMFTWTQPVVACNPTASSYKYSIKIVEVMKNQHPAEAIERNPVVYKRDNLLSSQCIIPQNIITTQFYTDRTYAAQVTATSNTGGALNYVMIENSGKSTYRLFKIKTSDDLSGGKPEGSGGSGNGDKDKSDDKSGDKDDKSGDKDKSGDEDKSDDNGKDKKGEEDDDFDIIFGDMSMSGLIDPTCDYTYSYPKILSPQFPSSEVGGARKMFMGQGIKVEWTPVSLIGGQGNQPDTLKFAYDVEIFKGDDGNLESTLESSPIYTKRITTELEDSIPWDKIKSVVENGNYMVIRVNPVLAKGSSVAFAGDKTHIRDFALIELLTKKYFQCASMVNITNTKPTTKKAADYKGKTIPIGQYQLTIDEIEAGSKKDTWKGKGHVLWQPMGFKVHVCVEFDDLKINTDDIVFAGTAKTYSKDKTTSNIDVVDKLFSDWGIDNLISDTGIPYANELQGVARDKVKDLAKKIDLSKYYGYVKKGQALYNTFLTGEVKDLYMPLSIPKSINKSPVDIQIAGMKFSAEYATMDIIGEFTLPNTSYTKNNILVLGAPRICISPDRVLPESGTIALLSDFTINDPKSSYEMTFKAPKNVIEPEDGCYVSWHADKFEMLGIDVDMKIPGLVKDNNGTATKEKPVLNARASISDWDDWMIDNITIDPFQATALPGWTFTASDIVYDHSYYRNSNKMGAFPTGYDKSKAGITSVVTNAEGQNVSVSGNNSWQGLYIKEIAIKFPKALEFGTSGDKRLSISAKNMFFDKSGATLNVSAANILSAKTGKAGGWSFSLDKVYVSFLQNNFSNCGFSGKFSVPLLSGQIGYDCKIYRLTSNSSTAGQYAYVFKTKQVDGLSLDFFLAQATFKKDQTYFLLESKPNGNTQETKVELLMGGDITIGGTNYLNQKIKNSSLPIKFEIPGVHFCGMRLANCANTWTSTYEKDMQKTAKNASLAGKQIYAGKEFQFASGKIYFHTGKWSLASLEKKIGPFEFSLSKYNFNYTNKKLTADLEGTIKLVSGVDISATTGLAINANVTLPSDLTKLDQIKITYGSTDFKKAAIEAKFAGMELSGSLTVEKANKSKEGYTGALKFKMPGDLFTVNANGGYYKYESGSTKYSYGYFVCKMASNVGIEITPIKITSITGGFYYNCKKNGDGATPEKGLIGVIAGIELATTAGKDALSANMDMTVVYDSKNKRLSTFIFNGKVQAINGLVNANANLVYENNNSSKYLQLDITVDATADSEKILNSMTGVNSSLSSLKSKLNSSYKSLTKKLPEGSLTAMNDNQSTPDKSKSGKTGESLSASAGATIQLQFKLTWKSGGTTYSKAKWHLYIGEPTLDKRCKFTFLKFKSKIVSIDIGANAYLCLGNELPNNGKLPAIPQKVANFLNGSGSGKGIESASLSEANRARESSLKDFEDQITSIGGGVMFGAQVYGYLDVDLGIFYLNAGATAGFDISIVKLPSTAKCTNLSGQPGYKGWYGYGQLYAYLYAKFGIRINLGFWKKDFDICDAGIGGLFQMQGPKPSHFEGKARVKLKLLGGLVNVDRRFTFECGQSCDLFYGNALDNFKLFGDLSIGYDNSEQGWDVKNAIDPNLLQRPYFTTEAPLNEPFRVLDETEKARLAKNYTGPKSDLDMEASRTFIFRSNVGAYVTLEEWNWDTQKWTPRSIKLKGQNRYANYLDLTSLTPNRCYKMTVTGYAKEIQKGVEVNPLKYNEKTNKYYNEAWTQTKTYYFRTGPSQAIADCPSDAEFEKLVAIAYPSYYNKVKDFGGYNVTAYTNDVKYPNIAFFSDVSNKIFKKGKLKWRLYQGTKLVSERDAKWSVKADPHCCNLTTSSALGAVGDKTYKLVLDYEVSKTVSGKAQITTTRIVDMMVNTYDGHWETGNRYGSSMIYEKPFIGSSICSIVYAVPLNTKYSDYDISRSLTYNLNGKTLPYRIANPYIYISYLTNYAFIGGWEFSSSRLDANITTCQSLIYTDKGGCFEGKLGTGASTYNIVNSYEKIRKLSTYTYSQYGQFTDYPLPEIDDEKYNYTINGLSRVPVYTPGSGNPRRVSGYIADLWSPIGACYRMCITIQSTLDIDFDNGINVKFKGKSWTNDLNAIETWYQNHRGQMFTQKFNNATLQVPAYQFPIVYGSCLENTDARKKVTLWGTLEGYAKADKKNKQSRGHQANSLNIFSGLVGKEYIGRTDGEISSKDSNMHSWDKIETSNYKRFITTAEFDIYRVNTYDIDKCCYSINYALYGEDPYTRFTIKYPLEYYNNYGK